jgi:hypothetical protein
MRLATFNARAETVASKPVNATAKMHRVAGAKIHQWF